MRPALQISGGNAVYYMLADTMIKNIRKFILPSLEIAGVWFAIWLWYYAALGVNNLANTEGFSLPPVVGLFVFASRYGITVLFGAILTFLVTMQTIRHTQAWHHAVSVSLLLLLLFSSIAFTTFSVYTGSCLCDAWRQWERHDHPTKSLLNTAPSTASEAVQD